MKDKMFNDNSSSAIQNAERVINSMMDYWEDDIEMVGDEINYIRLHEENGDMGL